MATTIDENNVPQAVHDAFKKKFPEIEIDNWEMEAEYEAEFTQNGKEVEVSFYPDGTISQIEYEIDVDELPEDVINSVFTAYPYCEIEAAEKVEKGDGTFLYEVDLKFEAQFTAEGEMVALGKDL